MWAFSGLGRAYKQSQHQEKNNSKWWSESGAWQQPLHTSIWPCLIAHAAVNGFISLKAIQADVLFLATGRDSMLIEHFFSIILDFHVEHDSIVVRPFLSSTVVTHISHHLNRSFEVGKGRSGKYLNLLLPRESSDQQSHTSLFCLCRGMPLSL